MSFYVPPGAERSFTSHRPRPSSQDTEERNGVAQDLADEEHERLMVERYEEPYYYDGDE